MGLDFRSTFAPKKTSIFNVILGLFSEPLWASFDLVLIAPRDSKNVMIFRSIFNVIFMLFWELLGDSFWYLFQSFSGSSFGRHFQGVPEGPGGSVSSTLSMKTKVRLLPPWPASEVVFEVKMGFQMDSKMLQN